MGRALLVSASLAAQTFSTTAYFAWCGATNAIDTTETNKKVKIRTGGTFSRLTIAISAAGGGLWPFRVNGNNQNQAVDSSGAAITTDTTNSDVVAPNNQISGQGVFTTATFWWSAVSFSAALGNHATVFSTATDASGTGSGTFYHPIAGAFGGTSVEADNTVTMRVGGTLKNLFVYVSAQVASADTTIRLRKNTANGNMSVLVPAGTTGTYEDTTNIDTVVDGDTICYQHTASGGIGITVQLTKVEFISANPSDAKNDIFAANGIGLTRAASGTTGFMPISGHLDPSVVTTENDQTAIRIPWPCRFSKMRIRLAANTYTADPTLRLRINKNTNGQQAIAIPHGVTGLFEDTTNTDTVPANGQVAYSIVGGSSGSITIQSVGITMEDLEALPMPMPQILW